MDIRSVSSRQGLIFKFTDLAGFEDNSLTGGEDRKRRIGKADGLGGFEEGRKEEGVRWTDVGRAKNDIHRYALLHAG